MSLFHTRTDSYMCTLKPVASVTENPSRFLAQWDQLSFRVQEVGVRFQLLTVEPNGVGWPRATHFTPLHTCGGCALLAASADQHISHTRAGLKVNKFLYTIWALAHDVTRHVNFLNINTAFDLSVFGRLWLSRLNPRLWLSE